MLLFSFFDLDTVFNSVPEHGRIDVIQRQPGSGIFAGQVVSRITGISSIQAFDLAGEDAVPQIDDSIRSGIEHGIDELTAGKSNFRPVKSNVADPFAILDGDTARNQASDASIRA